MKEKDNIEFNSNNNNEFDNNNINNINNIDNNNIKINNNDDNDCICNCKFSLNLLNKIKELEKDIFDQNLRFRAEIDNINKRNMLEIEKIYKFSLEKFFKELLPVLDNFNRTILEIKKENINLNILNEGIKLIYKSFIKTLINFGLSIINDINIEFNPNIHQAVITIENNNIPNNHVIEIIQNGYLLNGRLIRAAMVKVVINNNKNN